MSAARVCDVEIRLTAVRLERTREVGRELLHSVRGALPILVGIAGPIAIATLALLALAGMPPLKAVTLSRPEGAAVWLAQTLVFAWPAWALRRRLLPPDWCVQLRCLPLPAASLWRSDVAVSAAVLAPLAGLYALSPIAFALHRTAWFMAAWPRALGSLGLSWVGSCLLGAAVLAWHRRLPAARDARAPRRVRDATLLQAAPSAFRALSWTPWWRGATSPAGAGLAAGIGSVALLGLAWTLDVLPAVPRPAFALAACALLVALTERMQRALEAHYARLQPWLQALPLATRWRLQGRALLALPMTWGGVVLVACVLLAPRAWRPAPLAGFAAGLAAAPWLLGAVPAAQREAHVGLWALIAGVLTAFGSELWD